MKAIEQFIELFPDYRVVTTLPCVRHPVDILNHNVYAWLSGFSLDELHMMYALVPKCQDGLKEALAIMIASL
jgi:hypothetical protein